jgi:hypothetical protein
MLANRLLCEKAAIKKNAKEGKPMADETIIRLTDEQKRQMKEATGQDHEEFKVETVGTKLTPRVAPKRGKRLAAKAAAKRGLGPKVAAKRSMGPKVAAKRSMGPKVAAKRSMGPKVAAKRSMGPKVAAKKGGMASRLAAKRSLKGRSTI